MEYRLLSDPTSDTEIGAPSTKCQQHYSFDRVFLRRLLHLIKIVLNWSGPYKLWSTSKKAREKNLFWLYVISVSLSCGNEVLYYYVGLIPSRFYAVLSSKDLSGFTRFLIPCMLLVLGTAAGKALLGYIGGLFALKTRRLLTRYVHERYIRPQSLYTVVFSRRDIDNPDQRITQDIDKFSETLREILEKLIIAPVLVIYYTWKCWSVSGALGPLLIYGYFVLGSLLSRALMKPVINAVFFKESEEGNFRFLHVRLRQFAESIAFLRGEDREKAKANTTVDKLLDYQRSIVNRELPLHLVNEGFSYFGSILSYLIVAVPIFAGVYDDKDPAELSEVISKNSFFAMYLIFKFNEIIDQSTKLSDLAGYVARIGELLEVLREVNSEKHVDKLGYGNGDDDAEKVVFENVHLRSPSGKTVISNFDFTLQRGEHTVIVGPNGSGKSSLLRALAGLWQCKEGRVHVPGSSAERSLLFLPQVPYLVQGSLREQILYPDNAGTRKISDDEIRRLLKKVHLSHLEQMVDSFDTPYGPEWSSLLSPGEQQRLMFTRLLYTKPAFAVLDEATSAIDEDTELHLYKTIIDLGITVLSVSHHGAFIQLHHNIIALDGHGGHRIMNAHSNT